MLRFGIPAEAGQLSPHFGHAPQVALVDVDPETRTIVRQEIVQAPPHQHGSLPRLMQQHGVQVVIAGGIGGGAIGLLRQMGIDLVAGAPVETPESLVKAYLEGSLVTGGGACGCDGHGHDHGSGHNCHS